MMCWSWIDSSREREALTISCPGPGIASLRRCTAGPAQKNRENNRMQSSVDSGLQHSCCAASGAKRAVAASHYAATGLKVIRPGSPALR
jgi:hypothetical protein